MFFVDRFFESVFDQKGSPFDGDGTLLFRIIFPHTCTFYIRNTYKFQKQFFPTSFKQIKDLSTLIPFINVRPTSAPWILRGLFIYTYWIHTMSLVFGGRGDSQSFLLFAFFYYLCSWIYTFSLELPYNPPLSLIFFEHWRTSFRINILV